MKYVDKETRDYAEERARYLCKAYDIDESAREAFVADMTMEIVGVLEAFLAAVDKVSRANAEGLVGEAANRKMRREAAALLRKKKR